MPERFENGPLQIGEVFLEKYQILGTLGRGGHGSVYKALNLFMGREVAIKVLSAPGGLSHELRQRGRQEAALLGKLEHPNIVRVYDAGFSESGGLYIVMELLEGQTLADALRRGGPFSVPEGLRLLIELCDALEVAHQEKAIHRDLKPANIFLTKEGTPKILDFGVAKIAGAVGFQTQKNLVVGTLFYMSPEQIQGHPATVRSDLYALGLVAFQMLSGKHPLLFDELDPEHMDRRRLAWIQAKKEAPRLDRLLPHIPEYVARLVNTAIVKPPGHRFESARQMGATAQRYLARYEAGAPSSAASRRPLGTAWLVAHQARPARFDALDTDSAAPVGGAETEQLFAISTDEEGSVEHPWQGKAPPPEAARSLRDSRLPGSARMPRDSHLPGSARSPRDSGSSEPARSENSELKPLELSEPRFLGLAVPRGVSSSGDLSRSRELSPSREQGLLAVSSTEDLVLAGVTPHAEQPGPSRERASNKPGATASVWPEWDTRLAVALIAVSGFSVGLAAILVIPTESISPGDPAGESPIESGVRSSPHARASAPLAPSSPAASDPSTARPAPTSSTPHQPRIQTPPAPSAAVSAPAALKPASTSSPPSAPSSRTEEDARTARSAGESKASVSSAGRESSVSLVRAPRAASTQPSAQREATSSRPEPPKTPPKAPTQEDLPGPGLWLE